MSIERRIVLKGTALGIAGLTSLPSLATSSAIRRSSIVAGSVLALVNDDAQPSIAEAAFLQGVHSASGASLQTQRVNLTPGVIRNLEQQMRSSEPLQVVGLLDDALATLVIDAARSAGARIRWLSLHQVSRSAAYHRLWMADADECLRVASTQSTQWLTELGHALASPHPTLSPIPAVESTLNMSLTGSYVSFSIEVGRPQHHG